jgi:hypothetical protein
MWSSWVKRKGTTQVMYIVKLKDGPKRVKKTFSKILKKGFWNGMMEGEKMESHQKWFLKLKCFSPLKILTSHFIWRDSWSFSFSFSFFIYAPSLKDSGVLMIFEEKVTSSKTSFQMAWHGMHGHDYRYTSGGCIFQNGVMHANMAKPRLWRWGSCGYIGGGCTFRSRGMHANISGWG